jgi:lysozyme
MPQCDFIDLSHHNVIPSSLTEAKAAGIQGVIHKLTEGTSYIDSKVASRHYLAKEADMLWGLYHFVRPGDMDRQLNWFLSSAREVSDARTLFVLDWEDAGVSLGEAIYFLDELEKRTGTAPVLYSGHVLKEALGGTPEPRIQKYRLWICEYNSEATLPVGYDSCWSWQYTDKGAVPGVTPPTDLNCYEGKAKTLADDWEQLPGPPPAGQIVIQVIVPPGVTVEVLEQE